MNETDIKKLKTKFTIFIIIYSILLFSIIALSGIIIYRNNATNNNYKSEIERSKAASRNNIVTIAELNGELERERERNSSLANNIIILSKCNSQAQEIIDRIHNRNIQAIKIGIQIKESIKNNSDIYSAIESAVTAIEKIAGLLESGNGD